MNPGSFKLVIELGIFVRCLVDMGGVRHDSLAHMKREPLGAQCVKIGNDAEQVSGTANDCELYRHQRKDVVDAYRRRGRCRNGIHNALGYEQCKQGCNGHANTTTQQQWEVNRRGAQHQRHDEWNIAQRRKPRGTVATFVQAHGCS